MKIIHNRCKYSLKIIGILSLLIFLSSTTVTAQAYSRDFEVSNFYEMTEYSEKNNTLHVDDHLIDIPLDSDRWTITDLELNISNLELERETVDIEVNGTTYDILKNRNGQKAYGVEIDISEQTLLYGVEIYGALTEEDPIFPPYVQIQGYDLGTDNPNGVIWAQTDLNMSRAIMWYTQTFPSPISLSVGKYFLVLNGTHITDTSEHLWMYNDDNPTYPGLHSSRWTKFIFEFWTSEGNGRPYRYKLIQKVDRPYDPEEINMTAVIDGAPYAINNGSITGTGNLSVSDLNLDGSSSFLNIPVQKNVSASIEFDLDYKIHLENQFYSEAQLTIENGQNIQWEMTPTFQKTSSDHNYTVEFPFPRSWSNIQILRNGVDVTGETVINGIEKVVTLNGSTITTGASWIISADSTPIIFDISVQQTTYEPMQLIQFSVNPPSSTGSLTFIFVDSSGFPLYNETKFVDTENVFGYEIPVNPVQDSYYAIIYWYNQTDAGIYIQEYEIIVPFSLTTQQLVAMLSAAVAIPLVGVATVVGIKRLKRKREAIRQKIFSKFIDVMNLEHIIIVDKKSGLDVYDEKITGEGMEASLITGFLQAIRSFGIELTNSDREAQTIKLEYQKSQILMSEYKNLRMTLIMRESPSSDFIEAVDNLSHEIEEKFREPLENFNGETSQFQNISFFIAKHLYTTLIYPLKLDMSRKTRLTTNQKTVVNRVKSLMKKSGNDYFYVSQLFSEKKGFQSGYGDIILKLIDKGVFTKKITKENIA